MIKYLKRLHWSKPAGHRVHRKFTGLGRGSQFAKCDCIFLQPKVERFLDKLRPSRIRAFTS